MRSRVLGCGGEKRGEWVGWMHTVCVAATRVMVAGSALAGPAGAARQSAQQLRRDLPRGDEPGIEGAHRYRPRRPVQGAGTAAGGRRAESDSRGDQDEGP